MFKKYKKYWINDIIRILINPEKNMQMHIDLLKDDFNIIYSSDEDDILNKMKYTMYTSIANNYYGEKCARIYGSLRHNKIRDEIVIDFKTIDGGGKWLKIEHRKYFAKHWWGYEGFISSDVKKIEWDMIKVPSIIIDSHDYLNWVIRGDNDES